MDNNKIKNIDVWISINKNGFVNVSIDKPERIESLGKYKYKYPFVNYYIYSNIMNIIDHSKLNWNSDPEFFTLQY